jgi:hypothetical protein
MGEAVGAASDSACLAGAAAIAEWRDAAPTPRATRAALELARGADRALGLIAAVGPILIEGRFAADRAFAVALARLRPGQPTYRNALADGVAVGALRLAAPNCAPAGVLERIDPG